MDANVTVTQFTIPQGHEYNIELNEFEAMCNIWQNSFGAYFKQLQNDKLEIQALKDKIELTRNKQNRYKNQINEALEMIEDSNESLMSSKESCSKLELEIEQSQARLQSLLSDFEGNKFTEDDLKDLHNEYMKGLFKVTADFEEDYKLEMECKNKAISLQAGIISKQKDVILSIEEKLSRLSVNHANYVRDSELAKKEIKSSYEKEQEDLLNLMLQVESQIAEMSQELAESDNELN